MRLYSAINNGVIISVRYTLIAVVLGTITISGSKAFAQTAADAAQYISSYSPQAASLARAAAGQAIPTATTEMTNAALKETMSADAAQKAKEADIEARNKKLEDPNSSVSKAYLLAEKAAKTRDDTKLFFKLDGKLEEKKAKPVPPNIEVLQNINDSLGGGDFALSDDPLSKKISFDMRREAQKEAALSYGARGGLAKRSHQIMERMAGFETVLDKVFDFRSLLITAASGLLIEPPIIKEAIDAIVINSDGSEAAVAEGVFNINKEAKIVSAPRDWRQYIVQEWSEVPPPPRVLWPKNDKEQREWNKWVQQGWKAGIEQAEEMFEVNVNRLSADYHGMVRYRVLLAQGMVSAPYAMHEERGVTGDEKQMRVGDTALKITGPSKFITGANRWKPADQ